MNQDTMIGIRLEKIVKRTNEMVETNSGQYYLVEEKDYEWMKNIITMYFDKNRVTEEDKTAVNEA